MIRCIQALDTNYNSDIVWFVMKIANLQKAKPYINYSSKAMTSSAVNEIAGVSVRNCPSNGIVALEMNHGRPSEWR